MPDLSRGCARVVMALLRSVICVALAACAPRAAPSAKPATSDTVEIQDPPAGPVPAFDLNGDWYLGSGPEPDVPLLTVNTPCLSHPAAWILQQTGAALEAFSFPESYDQGVAQREPRRLPPSVKGKISGEKVTLDDATSDRKS